MNKVLRDPRAIAVFVLPALLLYSFLVFLPLIQSALYSLTTWDGIGDRVFIGLENFRNLFLDNRDGFLKSVGNTFYLAFLTLLIQLPLGLFLALVLSSGVKGENLFRTVYFIPVILPSTVIGLLWKRIYDPNFGLLNNLLGRLGMEHMQMTWLGNLDTVLPAVSAPIVWQWIGYHMILFYTAARGIPGEINEAASIDGAGPLQRSLKISIPMMLPVIKVSVIMAVIGTMKHFDLVYLMTNGGPAHGSEVPSTLLIKTIFSKYMYGYGSAMAVFIVIECLVLTWLIQAVFKRIGE